MKSKSLITTLSFTFAWTFFFAAHLFKLDLIPGFHYDEAWSALFSARIESEPGFFPYLAMSPYTAPWVHYWIALFFKLFGTNLWVFRLAGVVPVAMGILALQLRSRFLFGSKFALTTLPFWLSVLPAMVANHRFGIEITTFQVGCLCAFGLSLLAKSRGPVWVQIPKKWGVLTLASTVVGVTLHALFLAPLLSLLLLFLTTRRRALVRERVFFGAVGVFLALHFSRIALLIPEKDKALGLAGLGILLVLWTTLLKGRVPMLSRRVLKVAQTAIVILGIPALFISLVFLDSSWPILLTHGHLTGRTATVPGLLLALFLAFMGFSGHRVLKLLAQRMGFTLLVACFCTHATLIKAAPRYFETVFLIEALLISVAFEFATPRFFQRMAGLLGFSIASILLFFLPYFQSGSTWNQSFHFLFLKDQTKDFLNKQELVKWFGSQGCSFNQVSVHDSRMEAELKFLSLGDWKVATDKSCPGRFQVDPEEEIGESREHAKIPGFKVIPLSN